MAAGATVSGLAVSGLAMANVSCMRGGRTLFQNLSLDLNGGDIIQLSGPNGIGKTSLLRALAGRLEIDGSVQWQDRDISEKDFSYLPADDRHLKLLDTVSENLSFWCQVWRHGDIPRAMATFDLMDLENRAAKFLSAGQKRWLSLAIVFMKEAAVLLLDEPLNGLDAAAQGLLMTALKKHAATGGVALIASHADIPGARKIMLEGA